MKSEYGNIKDEAASKKADAGDDRELNRRFAEEYLKHHGCETWARVGKKSMYVDYPDYEFRHSSQKYSKRLFYNDPDFREKLVEWQEEWQAGDWHGKEFEFRREHYRERMRKMCAAGYLGKDRLDWLLTEYDKKCEEVDKALRSTQTTAEAIRMVLGSKGHKTIPGTLGAVLSPPERPPANREREELEKKKKAVRDKVAAEVPKDTVNPGDFELPTIPF